MNEPTTDGGVTTSKGFFTDTSVCIGCKACEVACKQWNQLPMDDVIWLGSSYDNTHRLAATTWRHVSYAEVPGAGGAGAQTNWLMMSDVCKHCTNAGCLQACPTGAIIRTEFNTVLVQEDVCNGCGYCVPSCPFGVIDLNMGHNNHGAVAHTTQAPDGKAHKCTLCYDRLSDGLEPACSKACPTDSIQFGDTEQLRARAAQRVEHLRSQGLNAYIYGDKEVGGTNGIGDLGAFFLLLDKPAKYNLPEHPSLPQDRLLGGILSLAGAAIGLVAGIAWSLRRG